MTGLLADIPQKSNSEAFSERHSSAQLGPYSKFRSNIGFWDTNVAFIKNAPPGHYVHPPYDGISIYMAMSRIVGRIDVGDGPFDMAALAHDFVVGVPGSGGEMVSLRGGHGIQVVISPKALQATLNPCAATGWDFQGLHQSFHSDKVVSQTMIELARVAMLDPAPDASSIDALVATLIEGLSNYLEAYHRRQREAPPVSSHMIDRLNEYMDANLASQINLDKLARLAGMSPTRFLKSFRNTVGATPYQYLVRRRMEAARLMLMNEDQSISDIAFACGFSSQQHLTNLFSERFGIAPAAFRRQIKSGAIVEHRGNEME